MRPIFRSKPAVVHDLLREQIIRGDYLPGARLVIDEVAAQLNSQRVGDALAEPVRFFPGASGPSW